MLPDFLFRGSLVYHYLGKTPGRWDDVPLRSACPAQLPYDENPERGGFRRSILRFTSRCSELFAAGGFESGCCRGGFNFFYCVGSKHGYSAKKSIVVLATIQQHVAMVFSQQILGRIKLTLVSIRSSFWSPAGMVDLFSELREV